jgi:DNA-binding MarR family transcriptional regulator
MGALTQLDGTGPSSSPREVLRAFEVATRDLVGVALRSLDALDCEATLPQFRLLLVLHDNGRSTCTQVAQAMGVAGSSVTRLAERLNASGHIARGADPANRSIVTLGLTAKGRGLVTQVNAARTRELSRVLDRIDPTARAACADGLRQLHDALGDGYAADRRGPVPL